jgi:hypothetical protein
MNRYKHISEAAGAKTIELYSELVDGQEYTIEGIVYLFKGNTGDTYHFEAESTGTRVNLSLTDLNQFIDAGDVKELAGASSLEETEPQFRSLDTFTRTTFNAPTNSVWERLGVRRHFNTTDLYTLDALCQTYGLTEMPLPGEGQYERLLGDEHWSLLKRYLQLLSPGIDLPEELG